MEKQYVLEAKDIFRFNWFVLVARNPLRGFFVLFALTSLLFAFIYKLFHLSGWDDFTQGSFPLVFIFVLIFVSSIISSVFRVTKKGGALRDNRVVLQPEGVLYQTSVNQSLLYWNAIKKFHMTKHHVYLMIEANRGIIIPRRAFDSLEEETAFVGQIQELSDRYQQGPQTQQNQQVEPNQQTRPIVPMQTNPLVPQKYNRPTFKFRIQLWAVLLFIFLTVVGFVNIMTGLHGK